MTETTRTEPGWVELRVACPPELREGVADFLITGLGAGGVLEREGAVSAYFPEGEAAAKAAGLRAYLASLRQVVPGVALHYRSRRVAPKDWAAGWKRRFRALRVGRRLVVRPSWRPRRSRRGEVVIEIDPGQAFGTGAHASTSLALEAIEQVTDEGRGGEALDVGTGTGILAITLARLGWERVVAIDIDPDAVAAARENTGRNGVAGRIEVSQAGPEALAGRAFDLVAANLSRPEHLRLVGGLHGLCRAGGVLILSGLLEEQAPEVEAAYVGAGMVRRETLSAGGWSCLVFERPGGRR
jgi:ribosomal protein L11 methyltransferase